jgi:hypothetical protein
MTDTKGSTYRRKPVLVEAYRWSSSGINPWKDLKEAWNLSFLPGRLLNGDVGVSRGEHYVTCKDGDWILLFEDGSLHTISDVHFTAHYEPVESLQMRSVPTSLLADSDGPSSPSLGIASSGVSGLIG